MYIPEFELLGKSHWTKKSVNGYIQKAFDEWSEGSCNKASLKRASESLNYAYDIARDSIQKGLLETPHEKRDSEWNEKYWSAIHYCHQWRQKHSDMFKDDYELAVMAIEKIVELKKMMKGGK